MGNPKLVPYETIVRATSGEPEAVEEVLRHYSKRIRVRMLMYGKEASNRKQEIDRQHRTIPNQSSQRPKDKYCGKIKTFGFFHNADYYGIPCIYLSDFALSSAKKSIPCLRNKCYNKAIDNRNLEVANMSGCLRLRNI